MEKVEILTSKEDRQRLLEVVGEQAAAWTDEEFKKRLNDAGKAGKTFFIYDKNLLRFFTVTEPPRLQDDDDLYWPVQKGGKTCGYVRKSDYSAWLAHRVGAALGVLQQPSGVRLEAGQWYKCLRDWSCDGWTQFAGGLIYQCTEDGTLIDNFCIKRCIDPTDDSFVPVSPEDWRKGFREKVEELIGQMEDSKIEEAYKRDAEECAREDGDYRPTLKRWLSNMLLVVCPVDADAMADEVLKDEDRKGLVFLSPADLAKAFYRFGVIDTLAKLRE